MQFRRFVCPVLAGIVVVAGVREAAACDADFTGGPKGVPDCTVGTSDLLLLLASWGPCPGCQPDLNNDGTVATADLLGLLSQWGPCPMDITEDANMDYGFDTWTNRNLNPVVPFKSVEVGEDDTVILTFNRDDFDLFFTSSNEANVTVAPGQTNTSPTTITVTGVALGDSDVKIRRDSATGAPCRTMKTRPYNKLTKTVAFVVIHEENDDVQEIPLGQGLSDAEAITAGDDGTLDTTPAGDDMVQGSTITTGADGICDTAVADDDVQVIPVGQGEPNAVCVSTGANAFRDTAAAAGDDVKNGDDFDTGPNGICETEANDQNVLGTGHGGKAAFTDYFNNTIYNQAVVSWTITELDPLIVNYDLNRDGEIAVDLCTTVETAAVITAAAGIAGFDHILFFVDNPDDGSCGCMPFSQTYGFMHPVANCHAGPQTLQNTAAHELGHGTVGLMHPDQNGDRDPENLMHSNNVNPDKLRKNQWDQLNP